MLEKPSPSDAEGWFHGRWAARSLQRKVGVSICCLPPPAPDPPESNSNHLEQDLFFVVFYKEIKKTVACPALKRVELRTVLLPVRAE